MIVFDKNFLLVLNEVGTKQTDLAHINKIWKRLLYEKVRCLQTLKSWTPILANMNSNRNVTNMMLPIVLTATITHWTTCWCWEVWKLRRLKIVFKVLFRFKSSLSRISNGFDQFLNRFRFWKFSLELLKSHIYKPGGILSLDFHCMIITNLSS